MCVTGLGGLAQGPGQVATPVSCRDLERFVTRYCVLVSLHPSAFRHGLTTQDIEHAWTTGEHRQVRLEDDHPERVLRVGTDSAGRPIEVVVLIFDQQRTLIIHAMKARNVSLDATGRRTP